VNDRPDFESGSTTLRLVDLFAGCGGISLGVAQAAHAQDQRLEVALAVDFDEAALEVYRTNFPKADTSVIDVSAVLVGEIGDNLDLLEQALKEKVGRVHALTGGPPCQGHSSLNNHTRRKDAKNGLYLKMVRAAEVFGPEIVMIENVPAVRHSKPAVVKPATAALESLGYKVAENVLAADRVGVPQRRKRHVLLAIASHLEIEPKTILDEIAAQPRTDHDVRWAIGDLVQTSETAGIFDKPPRASADNLARMEWLLTEKRFDLPNDHRPACHQGDHSYKSMYGRLRWDEPAQTITSGFSSIGQGRFMHPDKARALTPHEAARLQGFPDYYDFSSVVKRTDLGTMIGNAVPPALAEAVFCRVLPSIRESMGSS
jgi:DNA (cytosine-5)-methyltransferase 1